MNSIIEALSWRYATKKFDPTKKISPEDIYDIETILQLTASSYGLQNWRFIWVENPEIREQLKKHAYGQSQITDASHLLILCAGTHVTTDSADLLIQKTAEISQISPDVLAPYKGRIYDAIHFKDAIGDLQNWTDHQVYIVLGNILTSLAIMKIDTCPMEGFQSQKFDEILDLAEKNLHAVITLPIGYRSEDDTATQRKKVRYDRDDLFFVV